MACITPDGAHLYMNSYSTTTTIYKMDVASLTSTIIDTVPVYGGVAMAATNTHVYYYKSGSLFQRKTDATNAVVTSVSVPAVAAIAYWNYNIWVCLYSRDRNNNALYQYDTSLNLIRKFIIGSSNIELYAAMCGDSMGRYLYICTGSANIYKFNRATGTVSTVWRINNPCQSICVSPDNAHIYVYSSTPSSVIITQINTASGTRHAYTYDASAGLFPYAPAQTILVLSNSILLFSTFDKVIQYDTGNFTGDVSSDPYILIDNTHSDGDLAGSFIVAHGSSSSASVWTGTGHTIVNIVILLPVTPPTPPPVPDPLDILRSIRPGPRYSQNRDASVVTQISRWRANVAAPGILSISSEKGMERILGCKAGACGKIGRN